MNIKPLKSPSDCFDLPFPANKRFDAVGFGLNSVDHLCMVPRYPAFDSKTEIAGYEKLPGGQVATAMLFLARNGCRVKYIGKVGGDDLGRFFMDSFKEESIDIDSVIVQDDALNEFAFIIIDKESGERTILWQRDEKLNFKLSEMDDESIGSGKIIHLDGVDSVAALHAASFCRDRGIPVCIDLDMVVPDCRKLVDNIDFLIVSSNFCREFTGVPNAIEAFRALNAQYSGFPVMTLGAEGAVTCIGNQILQFPGMRVEAVDTTGAGDVFHGAFLYGLLRNWPLEKIMAFSNAAAGFSCKYLGAQSGIGSVDEILPLLGDNGLFSYRIV